jgi:hypothetical protein
LRTSLHRAARAKAGARSQRRVKTFEEAIRVVPVDILVAAARTSRNPLYYWQAYLYSHEHGLDLHPRVARYFSTAARRLTRPQGRGSKSKLILGALGLQTRPGQKNPFMRRDDFAARINAVLRIAYDGEKVELVALDTRIARRELQAYVQEFRQRGTVTSRKR